MYLGTDVHVPAQPRKVCARDMAIRAMHDGYYSMDYWTNLHLIDGWFQRCPLPFCQPAYDSL